MEQFIGQIDCGQGKIRLQFSVMIEQRISQNLPEGIEGYTLNGPKFEDTDIAIARAQLQQTSIALIKKHNSPFDLRLALTTAGTSGPSKETKDPYEFGWFADKEWLGSDPAVHARKSSIEGGYRIGVNIVSELPWQAGIVVDTLYYELVMPRKNVHAGAIAIFGMARYFTHLSSEKRRPDLCKSVGLHSIERGLQRLMTQSSNPKGDTWEWITTAEEPNLS